MKNTKQKIVANENELKQALYRVMFTGVISLYLILLADPSIQEMAFVSTYLAMGIGSYAFLSYYKKPTVSYRWVSLISDVAATSFGLYLTGAAGGIFLGVYLWLVTGYGLRYGRSLLIGAYVFSILGFVIAVNFNSYWQSQLSITVGFLITLVLIPLHVYSLLNKLASQTEKAKEASKAKSDFLSHISHEIRTPLNGVIGASQLLSETKLNNEQAELATIIVNSSTIVTDLISNVLDFSSIESGKLVMNPTNVRLGDIAQNVISLFKTQSDSKGIDLNYEFNGDQQTIVKVDALRLKQVLLNLTANAIKFTESGSVTLKIDSFGAGETDQKFKFSVIDTGIGMKQSSLKNVFDSFTQADSTIKEKFGGTGLGVTISSNIVNMMGGKLIVDSEVGVGTTFSFEVELPVVNFKAYDELENVSPLVIPVAEGSFKPINILVADDNETNRIIIKKILVGAGHHVALANDGDEALDALERDDYDLMLLDSNMPNQNGIDVIAAYRAMNVGQPQEAIPAIILSADATIEKINEILSLGANAYLTKPINKDELLGAIEDLTSNKPLSSAKVIQLGTRSANVEKQYLDEERLVELSMLDQNNEFLKNLISSFIADTDMRVQELQKAFDSEDHEAIRFIGHTLAGSAASIGAQELGLVAEAINKLTPQSSSQLRGELFQRLIDTFNTSKQQLLDYRQQQKINQ